MAPNGGKSMRYLSEIMTETKNDTAWNQLFGELKILEAMQANGHFEITAAQINKVREARLMTKFDHRSHLPNIFVDNNLSILPTSRGSYVIGAFEAFCDFNNDDVEVIKMDSGPFFESLDYRNIYSEANALNCALHAGILQHFTGEETLHTTVNGRMSSGIFSFTINSAGGPFVVSVVNSQMEIDGGYEGSASLCLVEAKNDISDDFLIRQLYYPFKSWSGKVTKKVRPVFLTYSNGVFELREYVFSDPDVYNSLQLIKHSKYIIRDGVINIEIIGQIADTAAIVTEPKVPFPQADSFERVINLTELVHDKGSLTKEDITANYDFDVRQSHYYISAARYLGLVETRKTDGQIVCTLTDRGEKLFDLPITERQKALISYITEHAAFKTALKRTLDEGALPTKTTVVEIMKASALYNVTSNETYERRASTVISWTNWILKQNED